MLLTTKLWLRLCNSSGPPRKPFWQEETINIKKRSFPSPLVKEMAIAGPIQNL